MYLKHAAGDGRISAFSQLWDSLPYPSSSDHVLRHSFSTHCENIIYAVFRQSTGGGKDFLAEGKHFPKSAAEVESPLVVHVYTDFIIQCGAL
jgi:hypothetical protein